MVMCFSSNLGNLLPHSHPSFSRVEKKRSSRRLHLSYSSSCFGVDTFAFIAYEVGGSYGCYVSAYEYSRSSR